MLSALAFGATNTPKKVEVSKQGLRKDTQAGMKRNGVWRMESEDKRRARTYPG